MLMTADTIAITADADAVSTDIFLPFHVLDEGDSKTERTDKLNANFSIIADRLFNT